MNLVILKKFFIFFYLIFQFIFILFVYFLFSFNKRKKNLWGFGSLAGQEFRGNTKYLYKYLEKNHKEIEIYWIAKSKQVNFKLQKKGINSIYAYDLNGIKKIASTSLFFCTHGFVDLVLALTRKAQIISLGHMTYAIKNNSNKDIAKKRFFLQNILNIIRYSYFYIRKIDFGVYSSTFSKENLTNQDKWYPSQKLIFGLPKSDYLFSLKNKKKLIQY